MATTVYPAQFAQFSLSRPAQPTDRWTVKVRGPGNFLCRSSVMAENQIVSLTYEPKFPGIHRVWIEQNGEPILENHEVKFVPGASNPAPSPPKSPRFEDSDNEDTKQPASGRSSPPLRPSKHLPGKQPGDDESDSFPLVPVQEGPPPKIHEPLPPEARPRKSSLKSSSKLDTQSRPTVPKQMEESRRPVPTTRKLSTEEARRVSDMKSRTSQSLSSLPHDNRQQYQQRPSSSDRNGYRDDERKQRPSLPQQPRQRSSRASDSQLQARPSRTAQSNIRPCLVCRKALPSNQQYLFNGQPYCHFDFRQLFPIGANQGAPRARNQLSEEDVFDRSQPHVVRKDHPPPLNLQRHYIPQEQDNDHDAYLGLSLADLRAAIKLFRLCRSFSKGNIKDEDCFLTLKLALAAKFNCDLPEAVNVTIKSVIENTSFISPLTVNEKEFLSSFAHITRYILLSELGVDVHDEYVKETKRIQRKTSAVTLPSRAKPSDYTSSSDDSEDDSDDSDVPPPKSKKSTTTTATKQANKAKTSAPQKKSSSSKASSQEPQEQLDEISAADLQAALDRKEAKRQRQEAREAAQRRSEERARLGRPQTQEEIDEELRERMAEKEEFFDKMVQKRQAQQQMLASTSAATNASAGETRPMGRKSSLKGKKKEGLDDKSERSVDAITSGYRVPLPVQKDMHGGSTPNLFTGDRKADGWMLY